MYETVMYQQRHPNGNKEPWKPTHQMFSEVEILFQKEKGMREVTLTYSDGSSLTFKKEWLNYNPKGV